MVRWNQPERGLIILPGEFILVAEESDLIILRDRWVLHEACRQMAEWHRTFRSLSRPTINVNIYSRHLSGPRLVEEVEFTLVDSGLRPESLAIEVTEGSLIGITYHQDTQPQHLRPCVRAINSVCTMLTLRGMRQIGKRLGFDVPFFSFDDFDLADMMTPSISAVRQPTETFGIEAANILFERIKGDVGRERRSMILPTELILRESCGCPIMVLKAAKRRL